MNGTGSCKAYHKVPKHEQTKTHTPCCEPLRVQHIASQGLFIPGLCAFERRDTIGDYGGLSFDAARWCFAGRWPGLACSWIRSVWISQSSKDPSVAWRWFWSLKCSFSCFCSITFITLLIIRLGSQKDEMDSATHPAHTWWNWMEEWNAHILHTYTKCRSVLVTLCNSVYCKDIRHYVYMST